MADTTAGARALLAADWWTATDAHLTSAADGPLPVMIAARRVDVADLNGLARTRMAQTGRLTGDTLSVASRDIQAGDRVVCLKNDRRLGVHNGTRATVVEVEDGALSCRLDSGDHVELGLKYLAAGHVDHGYATTLHKAQGSTTGQAYVLGIRESLSQEAGYVAMSRARETTRLYLVAGASAEPEHDMPEGPPQDAVDRAKWALAQSKAQILAHDAGPVRRATADDLEGRLTATARLLRTRPPGDAEEWTAEHKDDLVAAVNTGAEIAWRDRAQRVAVEADPVTRRAAHQAHERTLSHRPWRVGSWRGGVAWR